MSLFFNSKQKIRNLHRTIDALLDGDFPIESGKRALQKLHAVFSELDQKLLRAHKLKDERLIVDTSRNISVKVFQTLPILGFILRSTNVRNAFEFLEPLQCIADQVLQGRPELLLSSEWDYVPFAYPQSLPDLKSFVLIGLPASEAGSALLLPLAAHELGHAVWRNRGIEGPVNTTLQLKIEELFKTSKDTGEFKRNFPAYDDGDFVKAQIYPETIGETLDLAVFHSEEIFCDLFAYALFGESYLYAFSYVLAPGTSSSRTSRYPSYAKRLSAIRLIAKSEGISLATDVDLHFAADVPNSRVAHKFILNKAEQSVADIIAALWQNIMDIFAKGNVRRPSPSRRLAHHKEIENGVPMHEPECLGDIINAGWQYYLELQQSNQSDQDLSSQIDTLNEILLKGVEVLEFKHRTST